MTRASLLRLVSAQKIKHMCSRKIIREHMCEGHVHHPKAVQRVAERRRGGDKVMAEGVPGTIASLIGPFSGSP